MWEKGFKRFLRKCLELLGGKLSFWYNRTQFTLELDGEKGVLLFVDRHGVKYTNFFCIEYNELYKILAPDHQLKILYLMQDLIEQIEEGSHFVIVDKVKKDLTDEMAPKIYEYSLILEEREVLVLDTDTFFVSGKRFDQLKLVF